MSIGIYKIENLINHKKYIRSPFTKKEKNNKLPIFTSEAIRNAIYNSNRIKKLHCKTQSFSKSSRRVIKLKHPVIYNKYK